MDLNKYLMEKRKVIDEALENLFPEPEGPSSELIRAMKYSLLAGGKRLRPILCIAGAESVGGDLKDVFSLACAFELIHTYSLIHDDLPAMDNDDFRRGMPTSHKVFGEALAILAGDGLLTEAFHLIVQAELPEKMGTGSFQEIISLVAGAAGYQGMVGGQAVDISTEGNKIDASVLDFIHVNKTGALIRASVLSGAIIGGGSKTQVKAIESYGEKIGLAFQISDDILDVEGDRETMGKPVNADARKGKNTYPAIHGLKKSKEVLEELINRAIGALKIFDQNADPLRQIAKYIAERKK